MFRHPPNSDAKMGSLAARTVMQAWTAALVVALLCLASASAPAQEPPPDGWSFCGELTTVFSQGNAEALTFGLGSALENRQGANLLRLEAGGIRTEAVTVTRRAVGTPLEFVIEEEENREKTAEAY